MVERLLAPLEVPAPRANLRRARAWSAFLVLSIALWTCRSARAQQAAQTASAGSSTVLDFCYMPIKRGGTHSHKQRLVLFSLAGRDVAFGPEQELNEKGQPIPGAEHRVLRDVQIDSHLRSTFLSTYLMKRFYTVEADTESPQGLSKKAAVSDQDMIDAAAVDSFAAYSIACSDWVVFPRLVKKDAQWRKVKNKKTVNGRQVENEEWQLNLVWSIEADVYRRADNGFQLAATVDGSNGGALGSAFELASLAPHRDFGEHAAHTPVLSQRPAPGCNPPLLPQLSALTEGMSSCAQALSGLGTLASTALSDDAKAVSDAANQPPETKSETKPPLASSALNGLKAPKVLKDAKKDAQQADSTLKNSGAGEVAAAAEAAMTEEERAALEVLSKAQDKLAVDRVLALESAAKNSHLLKVIASAKGTWSDCQKPVAAVKAVSSELRALSQNPTAYAGKALLGLAACTGINLSPDMSTASPPGTDQLASKFCQGVDASVSRGAAAMHDVAVCQGRVAMERATLAAKVQTQRLPGIAFHSALTRLPGAEDLFGIALGKDEGADRGDMYIAMARGPDGTYSRVGFGRIALAGPGGDEAESKPSQFKFRSGTADTGVSHEAEVHVEEHAQIGVPLGLRPQINYYLMKGDLKTTLAYGAAIEGGYNASKFVPVADEVWGRACLSFAQGSGKELFGTLELTPEVVHYLGRGLAAYGGAGMALVFAQKTIDTSAGSSDKVRGFTYAALVNLGLDYALNPDWNARLSVGYRQGVSSTKLQNEAKTLSFNAGTLSAAQAGLSAGYTF